MIEIQANDMNMLPLGRQGENLAVRVVFDTADWKAKYGPGTVELIAQRPGDEAPYPVAVKCEGTRTIWEITSVDTAVDTVFQTGRCELRYYVGETLTKSRIWRLWVESAMDVPSETVPPAPERGWVDQVVAVGAEAASNAEKAEKDAKEAALSKEAAQLAQSLAECARKASEDAKEKVETAAIKQPYPNVDTGTWWVWDVLKTAYVDSGAPIADQPRVVELSGTELTLTLHNNTEVRCTDLVTSLTIAGFSAGTEGRAEQWGLVFTAGDTITVTVPGTLVWAVAEPVFTAGSTYWLSVVPMGDQYLAVWTEVSANGSESA